MATLKMMDTARVEVFVPERLKSDGNYEGHWEAKVPEEVKKGDLCRWKDGNEMKQQRALSVQKQGAHVVIAYDESHGETKRWGV